MPFRTSSPDSLEHASLVLQQTGVNALTVPITPMAEPFLTSIPEDDPIRRGNVLARLRMIVLYDRSAEFQGLVVGTGNKTEILLGYTTLFGDSACALNPIGDLYKTQVRQLARSMGVPKVILAKVAGDERDFTDIGGLYLPGPEAHTCTGPAVVPQVFDESPYIRQSGFYEAFMRKHRGLFNATWETNRGCPFSCSFCDWGSNTMSKLRRFDMERVGAEIAWFGRMKIAILYLADANFGMLPRDLEITDRLTETYARHGHPLYFSYNNAKNSPDDGGDPKSSTRPGVEVRARHQHTRERSRRHEPPSISRTSRSSREAAHVNRVTVDVRLIWIGYRALWRSCLGDLMEWECTPKWYFSITSCLAPRRSGVWPIKIETVRRYVFTFSEQALRPDRPQDGEDSIT
jgi:hypothetical protein